MQHRSNDNAAGTSSSLTFSALNTLTWVDMDGGMDSDHIDDSSSASDNDQDHMDGVETSAPSSRSIPIPASAAAFASTSTSTGGGGLTSFLPNAWSMISGGGKAPSKAGGKRQPGQGAGSGKRGSRNTGSKGDVAMGGFGGSSYAGGPTDKLIDLEYPHDFGDPFARLRASRNAPTAAPSTSAAPAPTVASAAASSAPEPASAPAANGVVPMEEAQVAIEAHSTA